MPATSTPAEQSAVADATPNPAVNTTPSTRREERRRFTLRGGERAKQFALTLKANAEWMKEFLHGGL